MKSAVICSAVRTPIGKFLGGLSSLSPADLGVAAVVPALESAGISPDRVDELRFGCGRQAGGGPNVARQIAVRSGIPVSSTAVTINMACGSGLLSIIEARDAIERSDAQVMVAGGTESMSQLPFYLLGARKGYRLGQGEMVDGMYRDGFHCPMADQLMGATAENLADEFSIDRQEQDAYAVESQQRCQRARQEGRFREEIAAVEIPGRKGVTVVDTDEHPRDGATIEGLARLKPVFKSGGSVHAGNSSGITDGACALVIADEELARSEGWPILATLGASARAGVEPQRMGIGPVPAIRKLLEKTGQKIEDFDLVELNEAFAAQVIACLRELPIDSQRLNVNGGSIALGHPIGATGARITTTLLHELRRRGGGKGLATLCISGGMGLALEIDVHGS
ncbi:MAG: acetyl-CoA C-acetyltransferase [Planctomycetes bacterium]|jgi:acetyl-CoA C-acetyltransferase|nr:acetyl-CoA C-acetyltransferase [Planctomycetota bacterium]MBT6453825.1 acetyl-CoA C-acetyltransferase [Planctomycetota bacterium]MBT6540874.1 acetyl-CoA C-acetyltransferase [Planctomycetota bacterium]MBT6784553.1 acetyl-CoA C-acetyltransferase [Planctomycetota bacterium]MBT6967970.1 acetyl-CoA C-acetyltransferase [Planctomycetota bacterium]